MAKVSLTNRINRFFYRNQNRGIHNLMLYIAIGNAVVYVLYLVNRANPIFYNLLVYRWDLILRGQVWRMLTYPLVVLTESSPIFGVIGLLFYYWCGLVLEQYWGTLRFNIYYLMGVLLTGITGLLVRANASAQYVNLSLFLAIATVQPDEMIRIWFVIPVKMKWLALVDLIISLIAVINGLILMFYTLPLGGFPHLAWILPLVALANYFLFFGKQSANLLPDFIRYHPTRKSWKRKVRQVRIYDDLPQARGNARFRCTVCGRTELSDPKLQFRYCSKCAGYRCYCEDHINNHPHLTE